MYSAGLKKAIAVAAAVLLAGVCSAGADTSDTAKQELIEKISELDQANKRLDALIFEIESDIGENSRIVDLYMQRLEISEAQVDYYSNLIHENEREIEAKETELKQVKLTLKTKKKTLIETRAEIENLNIQNEKNIEVFGDIMAGIYMNGSIEEAPFIQGSSDIYDVMIAIEVMNALSEKSLKFMDEFLKSIDEQKRAEIKLGKNIVELENEEVKLEKQTLELAEKRKELNDYLSESKKIAAEYKSVYIKYQNELNNLIIKKSTYNQSKRINKAEAEAFDNQLQQLILNNQTYGEFNEGAWLWPLESKFTLITTNFGYDEWRSGSHNGIDIAGSGINWSDIYAVKAGTVTVAETSYTQGYSYGKFIVIDHGGGYVSLYGHCNDIYVHAGQKVEAGSIIGAVGSTGWSTGPHLHFEIRVNGIPCEPREYIGW